jgi:amino acid permease
MRKLFNQYLLPAGFLAEAIIGAGIFALPFVFSSAGIVVGLFFLVLVTGSYIIIYRMYADLVLRTPGEHRFVGYAKYYFGRAGFWLATLTAVLGALFALTIYLVLSASFIRLLVGNGVLLPKILIFWFLGSLTILLNIRRLVFLEFLILIVTFLIIGIIFFTGLSNIKMFDVPMFSARSSLVLLPLAPLIFSLAGRVAIDEMMTYFKKKDGYKNIKRAISLGTIVPAIIYALFIVGVLSINPNVTEDAVSGLTGFISPGLLLTIGGLGILLLWSTYIVIGLNIKEILERDFSFSKLISFIVVGATPLVIYFSGFTNFIKLVSVVGGVFIVIESLLILAMWQKANRTLEQKPTLIKPSIWLTVGVGVVFGAALVYVIMNL